MDRTRCAAQGTVTPSRRVAPAALLCALALAAGLALTGCQLNSASISASPGASGGVTASAAALLPGTHRSTSVYTSSSPVSALLVVSQVGNVTVTGGSGSTASVIEESTYSTKPPVTTQSVSGGTLALGYACPAELVCAVVYDIQVPRTATVQVTADAGRIVLTGLAGQVTAKADAGLITATGLTGSSVSLTTDVGAITANFAAAPATIQAVTRVGAITLWVPTAATYAVTASATFGQANVRIPQTPSASHTITATTDVGGILVAYGGSGGLQAASWAARVKASAGSGLARTR
jgi:Putative adhesin